PPNKKGGPMAAFFYFSAFFKGLPVAQDNLAFMSYTYYPQAATWTPRAAEQGYAQAQTDLGYLYKQGKGVSLNTSPPTPGTILRLPAEGDRRAAARMKSLSSIMTR